MSRLEQANTDDPSYAILGYVNTSSNPYESRLVWLICSSCTVSYIIACSIVNIDEYWPILVTLGHTCDTARGYRSSSVYSDIACSTRYVR